MFKPYEQYKPSGIEWLSDVPEHWKVKRLKYVLREPLKYGANESAELDDRELPRYVRITDIDEQNSLRAETFRSLPIEVARPYLLQDGDILFARSGATSGKTFLYKRAWGPCAYAGYLIRARLDTSQIKPTFVRYFTASNNYWQWLSASFIQATIQNVSAERYADLSLPLPHPDEQSAIADFLDRETAKIDTLVAKKRTLIERLKEKRTALISRTVTRGLPPDAARAAGLDPHPKLKPSGIDWLREIPRHWTILKFGFCAYFQEGPGLRNWQFSDDGIRVICVTNITESGIDFSSYEKFISEQEYAESYRHFTVSKGDLLISSSGNSWGKVAEFNSDARSILNTSTIRINCNKAESLRLPFLKWLIQAECTREQLGLFMTGSCQPNFGPSHLAKTLIPIPPKKEQSAIADYLNYETANLDQMLKKVESAIERLQEYRTALITAAVTGKIDVRGTVT